MTSPLIEQLALAIKAEMGRQFGAKPVGVLPTDDWQADGSKLNLEEVAQAALKAISESGTHCVVETEASRGLLASMAMRFDHGIFAPGQWNFTEGRMMTAGELQSRADALVSQMSQLYEEVVGAGFYRPENEQEYLDRAAMLSALPDTGGE